LLDAGERIIQETRHWDESEGCTHGMRSKEGSSDYRYFPEPDLLPVAPTPEDRAKAREGIASTKLPSQERATLVNDGVAEDTARTIVGAGLAEFMSQVASHTNAPTVTVANWIQGDVLAKLNEDGIAPEAIPLAPEHEGELLDLLHEGKISRAQAREVHDEVWRAPRSPKQVVEERGLSQVSDESELAAVIDEILAAHPDDVAAYRAGDEKARKKKRGFLMGEAMKATKGTGNPQLLNKLLDDRLAS
jgi:aspartyl-tRNA(Asn)/glutamyl-tRNA(Gln) amidotransferase subunit B